MERVADRLGLRHQPAAARPRRGDGDRDRAQPGRRRHHRREDQGHLGVDRQPHVRRHATARGRVFCMGDADPPASAEQRPRLQHLHPGRVQPGLEARARPPRHGGARSCWTTYNAERAPIARADRRRAPTRASTEFGQIFEALGMSVADDPAEAGHIDVAQGRHPGGRRRSARRCGRRSRSRTTSSTRTASSSASATRRPRSSPTARRSRRSTATPSSTTSRPPGPARKLPHCWLSRGAQHRSPRSTSSARAASPCSPASAARPGSRRPSGRRAPRCAHRTRSVIGPGANWTTCTATGPGRARSPTPAASWSARTPTSPTARSISPKMPLTCRWETASYPGLCSAR